MPEEDPKKKKKSKKADDAASSAYMPAPEGYEPYQYGQCGDHAAYDSYAADTTADTESRHHGHDAKKSSSHGKGKGKAKR